MAGPLPHDSHAQPARLPYNPSTESTPRVALEPEMIDLAQLAEPYFGLALESSLRQLGSAEKATQRFLEAAQLRLDCGVVWLDLDRSFGGGAPSRALAGDASLVDDELTRAFAAHQRPVLPKQLLLLPLRVAGRRLGVLGAARSARDFSKGSVRFLSRLGQVLATDLDRREAERLTRVVERIREKVVAELRPRDLSYQILHGLAELVQYDHSATLFLFDAERAVFRVEAEKVAWRKAKSAFIGSEIPAPAALVELLSSGAESFLVEPSSESPFTALARYHLGGGIPEPTSLLFAPLSYDHRLLGLLKLASFQRPAFDEVDRGWVERVLPAARVALRNVEVRLRLEQQAVAAELRAGLSTLARAVAHDVNGAVGAIGLLAEQLKADLADQRFDPAALAEDLEVILAKTALCRRVFSNMLRAGGDSTGAGPVDVNQVVLDLMPLVADQIGRRPIRVVADLAEPLPTVRSARSHLERIAWNLINNALEALESRSGEVVVSTRAIEGLGVFLTVRDDGPGIPLELIERVQEPFFSTKPGSTGLGLALTRALAWQHGGGLRIESAPGVGTSVEIQLPFA